MAVGSWGSAGRESMELVMCSIIDKVWSISHVHLSMISRRTRKDIHCDISSLSAEFRVSDDIQLETDQFLPRVIIMAPENHGL